MIPFFPGTFFEIEIDVEIEGIRLRRWRWYGWSHRDLGFEPLALGLEPSALGLELARPFGPGVRWVISRVNGRGLPAVSCQVSRPFGPGPNSAAGESAFLAASC